MVARRFTVVGYFAALLGWGFAWPAQALEFLSVSEAAPLYDAPSSKAKPLFVIAAGTPVERVVSLEGWSKVRDSDGGLAWIEKKYLSEKRNVMVRVERAEVHAAADEKSPLVFAAERDVLLELVEAAPGGWIKVKHRDDQSGYLRATQVWGL